MGISIHAPLAGRDFSSLRYSATDSLFQSTRPLRGATLAFVLYCLELRYFNPRAPCGARLLHALELGEHHAFQSTRPLRGATLREGAFRLRRQISIHAPLAGRDGVFK